MSGPTPEDLTRLTINLRPEAVRALARVRGRGTKSGAIDRALRLAAAVRDLADDAGAVTILGPDGQPTRVVVL